jgi:hypothetical protein
MPQLYTFVVCDKVIIDEVGVASLITLFSTVTLSMAGEIPSDALAPKEWAIFAIWDYESADEGKEYNQVVQLLLPDRTSFLERLETKFVMRPGRKQQIKNPVLGFPVGQQGNVTVRLWLEHAGNVIFEARPILLEVKHAPPDQAAETRM